MANPFTADATRTRRGLDSGRLLHRSPGSIDGDAWGRLAGLGRNARGWCL